MEVKGKLNKKTLGFGTFSYSAFQEIIVE